MKNTFYEDVERGKIGEKLVSDYFTAEGCFVQDVSNNKDFQKEDVDLLLADGTKYEIKTDYRYSQTGNLAIEDCTIYRNGGSREGWLWGSKADKIAFVNPHRTDTFVSIGLKDLQFLCKTQNLKKASHFDGFKQVKLFLLPPREYKEWFEVHRISQ